LLLFLLCLFCCFRALFDTIMACFGGGKRKHTHEETYIEEHHHSSAGGAAASGGGRRWYGQGPSRPARSKKSGGGVGNALGIGALLGGAALALGLKRKHDRKNDEKSTTVSGSSAYYSDEYTSTSK
jgi:ubiquitin-activating enzyme E1